MNGSSERENSTNDLTTIKAIPATQYTWKEIVKRIDNDPRTRPAESLTNIRDPFQGPQAAATASKIEEQAIDKPPILSPTNLGITLTSTIIGPQGRIARIGGRTYKQGQTIKTEKDGRTYKFILTEIRDRQVILEAEGEHFELSIPEPGQSGHMVLGTVKD